MQHTNTRLTLQPGSECIIHSLGADNKIARQLARMGVLPGSRLRVIRLAPLGGTVEVCIDGGQYFALRDEEIEALDCEMLAMPLSASSLVSGRKYRIRALSGGIIFQKKMQQLGVRPGAAIRIHDHPQYGYQIELLPEGKTVELGRGEAEKILVEAPGEGKE